jgi:hypothetical protein
MSEPATSKPASIKAPGGSPFLVPAFLAVMLAISAIFYAQNAKDDVDRYPTCFIHDCTQVKTN